MILFPFIVLLRKIVEHTLRRSSPVCASEPLAHGVTLREDGQVEFLGENA